MSFAIACFIFFMTGFKKLHHRAERLLDNRQQQVILYPLSAASHILFNEHLYAA